MTEPETVNTRINRARRTARQRGLRLEKFYSVPAEDTRYRLANATDPYHSRVAFASSRRNQPGLTLAEVEAYLTPQ